MSLTRRLAAAIAAILLTAAMALAVTAVTAHPARASGFGFCTILQQGQYRWQYNRLYQCRHIKGLGYVWVYVGTYYGCGPASRATRAC